jgi:hypothetical protein
MLGVTTQPQARPDPAPADAAASPADAASAATPATDSAEGAATPADAPTPAPQPCARCGGDAPFDFGGLWLCLDCYHVAGSTCAGVSRPARPVDPVC